MQVATTQSQALISSIRATRTTTTTATITGQLSLPPTAATSPEDVLAVGGQIDRDYVQRVLETELGESVANLLRENGIEGEELDNLLGGAVDLSPEATASRIVEFATSFYAAFQTNHADQESLPRLDDFTQLIRGAVDEGFAQSRDLLEGLGEISEETAADIDRTYGLVMGGIDDFDRAERESLMAPPAEEAEAPEEPSVI
jgi:hypothetical protein